MKSWLKGGLIGVSALIVLEIVAVVYDILFIPSNSAVHFGTSAVLYIVIGYPFTVIFYKLGIDLLMEISMIVSPFIVFFLIGSFLGWLYGKFKNKK